MPPRPTYEADREVIEACRAHGLEITPRQLERWRPFLPARDVAHTEGVRGSRTTNPAGYVDQVIAISETLRAGIPLRQLPIVLFMRNFPVRVEVLRDAYLGVFSGIAQQFESLPVRHDSEADDLEDRVDAMAAYMAQHPGQSPPGRRWEARARQLTRQGDVEASSSRSLLGGALSAAFTGPMTGTPASPEGIAEALDVLGLNDGQDPQHVADHLATLNLNAIIEAIRSASLDEWVAAREALTGILKYSEIRRRVENRLPPTERTLPGLAEFLSDDPFSQAIQIPGLLIVANDEWRQNLHSELAKFAALESLLSSIPEKFHEPLLRNQISEEIRRELSPIATAWAHEHPDQAKLLSGPRE
jgi:hypothetical protein